MTETVNVVSQIWTVAQVKQKLFHIIIDAKKELTDQRKKKETGGGQGPPDLSAEDKRLKIKWGVSKK